MANFIKNFVHVDGTEIELEKFNDFVNGEKNNFDFQQIIPMPEDLNLPSGTSEWIGVWAVYTDNFKKEATPEMAKKCQEVLGQDTFCFFEKHKNIFEQDHGMLPEWGAEETPLLKGKSYLELGKKVIENKEKYGYIDWFNWSVDNWGTKWNSSETGVAKSKNSYTYTFETAWSRPEPIFDAIVAKFPELSFIGEYASEDIGYYCGIWHSDSGKVCNDVLKKDAIEFATGVWQRPMGTFVENNFHEAKPVTKEKIISALDKDSNHTGGVLKESKGLEKLEKNQDRVAEQPKKVAQKSNKDKIEK